MHRVLERRFQTAIGSSQRICSMPNTEYRNSDPTLLKWMFLRHSRWMRVHHHHLIQHKPMNARALPRACLPHRHPRDRSRCQLKGALLNFAENHCTSTHEGSADTPLFGEQLFFGKQHRSNADGWFHLHLNSSIRKQQLCGIWYAMAKYPGCDGLVHPSQRSLPMAVQLYCPVWP